MTSAIIVGFYVSADPGGRAVEDLGLRALACWDCGFDNRRGHECLSGVLRFVKERCLRRADRSSRGVLPCVVCLSVIV